MNFLEVKWNKANYLLSFIKRSLRGLNIKIDIKKSSFLKSYKKNLKRGKLKLNFFECDSWFGKIRNNEHQKIRWIYPSEIRNFNILKSNDDFVKYLMFYYFPSAN